jgi:hypothetical protein
MRDLYAEYKRETGMRVKTNSAFQSIDADDMNEPTVKKQEALALVQSDGFLDNYYLVDKDFYDWAMEKAGR